MPENWKKKFFCDLSKNFSGVGIAVLGLFGFLLKSRLENNLEDADIYLIITGVIATGLLVMSSVLLFLASKPSKKSSSK